MAFGRRILVSAGVACGFGWPGVLLLVQGEPFLGAAVLFAAGGIALRTGFRAQQPDRRESTPIQRPATVGRWTYGLSAVAATALAGGVAATIGDAIGAAVYLGCIAATSAYLGVRVWQLSRLLDTVSATLPPDEPPTALCGGRFAGLVGWMRPPVALVASDSRILFTQGGRPPVKPTEVSRVWRPPDAAPGHLCVALGKETHCLAGLPAACSDRLSQIAEPASRTPADRRA